MVDKPVSVADNAWLSMWNNDVETVLGMTGDTVTLDRWDLSILDKSALSNKTIVVNDNRILTFTPVTVLSDPWAYHVQGRRADQRLKQRDLCRFFGG